MTTIDFSNCAPATLDDLTHMRQELANLQGKRHARARFGDATRNLDAKIELVEEGVQFIGAELARQQSATFAAGQGPTGGKASDAEVQRLVGLTPAGSAMQWRDRLATLRGQSAQR